MAKYSYEFKKKVVSEYINDGIGSTTLAKKYSVPSEKLVRNWIHAYREFGDEGLMRSRKNTPYTYEFKLHVVELYLTSEVSYQELAFSLGISNSSLIPRWVNEFRVAGPDALRPKMKGRKKTLDSKNAKDKAQSIDTSGIDTSVEHVRELEDELLKLRIENAFLKELRRLRLEDEAKMRDVQESSTASEDSSN